MKKQVHVPRSGTGRRGARPASCRPAKARPGPGPSPLLHQPVQRTAAFPLQVKSPGGWCSLLTGLAVSHGGVQSGSSSCPGHSWALSASPSPVAPALPKREEAQAHCKGALVPPSGCGGPCWWSKFKFIQMKSLAGFLALSTQALGRQKRLRWLLCLPDSSSGTCCGKSLCP